MFYVAFFILAVRLILVLGKLFFGAVAVLFLSPLWPKEQKVRRTRPYRSGRAPSPPRRRALERRQDRIGTLALVAQPGGAMTAAAASRNEADCAIALTNLGFGKPKAREIAAQVARDLGPNADLNAMVKRGLQLLGPVR